MEGIKRGFNSMTSGTDLRAQHELDTVAHDWYFRTGTYREVGLHPF